MLGGDDSSQETAESDQKSDSSQSSTSSDQAVDALGAVEEIVGEVGANETLTQQIESFKLKAQQMADTGKAQGDRMMIKYGIYVVNQVKKVQEDIANGQKMSITERNNLKSELFKKKEENQIFFFNFILSYKRETHPTKRNLFSPILAFR